MAAERYDVTSLPFIPFSGTGGEALSHSGAVVGGISNPDGSVSLAEWFNGALTNWGPPPGLPSRDFDRPRVFGINGAGTVVGTVHTAAGDLPSRAFIYDRGRFTVLPLSDPTDRGGAAIGVNSSGEVVGYDHTSTNRVTAWLWSNDAYSSLPVSGTHTVALGINSSSAIVGNRTLSFIRRLFTVQLRCRGQRGYVLSHGMTQHLNGFVNAINDLGDAAGGSSADGRSLAAVFKDGITTEILNVPSSAVGINSAADVVGFYQPDGCDLRRLFLWSASSGAVDLTPDGYRSAQAAAINDRGDVLGFGETLSGEQKYFLLTPDSNGALIPKSLSEGTAAPRARTEHPPTRRYRP